MIEYLGFAAALLTTCAFIPQAWKTIKTKDTSSISLTMYILLIIGLGLWLAYGILLDAKPIIYANVVTGLLSLVILYYKVKEVLSKPKKPVS